MMNRKTFFRSLFLLAMMLTGTLTATAYDFEVDGIYYNKNSDGTSVSVTSSSGSRYSGSVTIPSSVMSPDLLFTIPT